MIPKVSKLPFPPVISAGPMRMNTPPKPIINPTMDCQVGFAPPVRSDSNKTSQNGDVEIISAAMPEGIVCSAQATNPFPPSSNAAPTIAADFQLLRVGAGSPAIRRQMKRIAPERRNRNAACRKGGIVSTEKRIARYVEPQTIYSASKATQILVFIYFLFATKARRHSVFVFLCILESPWLIILAHSQTLAPATPSFSARHNDNFQTRQLCGSRDDKGSAPRSGCDPRLCQLPALRRACLSGPRSPHRWSHC